MTAACLDIPSAGCAFPPPSQMGAQPSGRVLLCPLRGEGTARPSLVPCPWALLGRLTAREHGEEDLLLLRGQFLCVFCREGPSRKPRVVGFLDGPSSLYRVRGVGSARAIWGRTVSRGGEGDEQSSRKSRGWIWPWSISDQPQAAGTWGSPWMSGT